MMSDHIQIIGHDAHVDNPFLASMFKVGSPGRRKSLQNLMKSGAHMDPHYKPKSLVKADCAEVADVAEFDSTKESRILVLYTGGTIGMKSINGVYSPYPNFLVQELRKLSIFHDTEYVLSKASEAPEDEPVTVDESTLPLVLPQSKDGKRIVYTVWEYNPLLDSCNITMTDWARLCLDIKNNYDQFEGFVILHGTDTMGYTASALSFMLEDLGKPVILTGSQIPIFETRSDGRDNFLGALIMAGQYNIPEVTVYFNHKLLRGNRSTKIDSGAFNAFHSPNISPLAELEIDINVNWSAVFRPSGLKQFNVHTTMCPHVGLLRLFPSISAQTVESFMQPPMQGIVIQAYGAGNGPDTRADLMAIFKKAGERGVLILNITQCHRGGVSVSYAAGKALFDAGIIPGGDMTPEAALTKLSYILSKSDLSHQEKKRQLSQNLRGEMRVIMESKEDVSLLEFPLVEKLKDTLRLSSSEEVKMLKDALFPSLLCTASREGDKETLEQLKDAGALFSQTDYDGRTALHVAACEGHLEIVQYLLGYGASVHERDRYGNTPLDDAINFDQHEIIKILVQTGAHVNHPDHKLGTHLCHAAMHEEMTRIKSWYLAGVDINQGDYDGRTALHVAVARGSLEVIQYLLDVGASKLNEDAFSLTPVDEAIKRGDDDIILMLKNSQKDENSVHVNGLNIETVADINGESNKRSASVGSSDPEM